MKIQGLYCDLKQLRDELVGWFLVKLTYDSYDKNPYKQKIQPIKPGGMGRIFSMYKIIWWRRLLVTSSAEVP